MGKETTIRQFYNGKTCRLEAELIEIDERGLPKDDDRRHDEHYYIVMTTDKGGAWLGGTTHPSLGLAEKAYNAFVDTRVAES